MKYFKTNKKLAKELEETKAKLIAKIAAKAEEISEEKGVKYVPAHELVEGIYLPEAEKIKIDRQYREDIKKVQEQ